MPILVFLDSLTNVANKSAPGADLLRNGRTVNLISAGAIFLVLALHWQDILAGFGAEGNTRRDLLSIGAIALFLAIQALACFSVKECLGLSCFRPFKRHGRCSAISLRAESVVSGNGAIIQKSNRSLLRQQSLAIGSGTNHGNVPYWTLAKAKNPTVGVSSVRGSRSGQERPVWHRSGSWNWLNVVAL